MKTILEILFNAFIWALCYTPLFAWIWLCVEILNYSNNHPRPETQEDGGAAVGILLISFLVIFICGTIHDFVKSFTNK